MSRNTVKQGGLGNTIKQGIQMLQGRDVPNYTLVFLDPTSDKGQEKNKPYGIHILPLAERRDQPLNIQISTQRYLEIMLIL